MNAVQKGREWPGLAALWLCATVTILFGVAPNLLLKQVSHVTAAPAITAKR